MIKQIFYVLSLFLVFNSLADPNIDFTIALHQNNVDILQEKLLDISDIDSVNYGKYMDIDTIMNIIEPDKQSIDLVVEWLRENNINENEIKNYGDNIAVSTSINNVENLFNVTMVPYRLVNSTVYFSTTDYIIPKHLKNIIQFVEGITKKFDKNNIKKSINNNSTVDPGYVAKEVVERLYNIKKNTKITKISAGSIEYQGSYGFDQNDLLKSQKQNGELQKKVSSNHIIGNNSFPDTESQLDMQMISQTADDINLWFWGNHDWLYSFSVNFFNQKDIPDIISMSWGWAEDQQCTISNCTNITSSQYLDRVNVEYTKIGLRGTTITVSSGDAGAPGRTSESCDPTRPLNPVFPGSSPWVTSIGATFVVNDPKSKISFKTPLCNNNTCAKGNKEYPINFDYTGWTAGGGFSIYQSELMPKWQKKLVTNYLDSGVKLPTKFNKKGRSYPDISVVGHNCPIFSNGDIEGVDGTSCSSPIFAGIVSILNQHQIENGKPKLGYINPILYKMAENDTALFNDLSSGNNWCTEDTCCPTHNGGSDFGFASHKGYDPVTGLGTPNVGNIINWLDKNT